MIITEKTSEKSDQIWQMKGAKLSEMHVRDFSQIFETILSTTLEEKTKFGKKGGIV